MQSIEAAALDSSPFASRSLSVDNKNLKQGWS
jgi:hypothetical protein